MVAVSGGNLHFLAKARNPAAALAHAEEVVPGVEGALQQRRARLRLEQLEHAAEGEEDGALLDGGFVGVGGLLIRLRPVDIADNNADAG